MYKQSTILQYNAHHHAAAANLSLSGADECYSPFSLFLLPTPPHSQEIARPMAESVQPTMLKQNLTGVAAAPPTLPFQPPYPCTAEQTAPLEALVILIERCVNTILVHRKSSGTPNS